MLPIFLIIFLLFSYAPLSAMMCGSSAEKRILEMQPLLHNQSDEEEAATFTAPEPLLKQIPDELVAHIFSFLPADGPELNYLMRLDGFQPTTNPVQASPFYPIVKKIKKAHANYIVGECLSEASRRNPSLVDRQNSIKEVAQKISSCMKTTQYNRVPNKRMFIWSDIAELNRLMPHAQSGKEPALNAQAIGSLLSRYKRETESQRALLQNETNAEKIYLKARLNLLQSLKKRIMHYSYYYNDRISCKYKACPECVCMKTNDQSLQPLQCEGLCMGLSGAACCVSTSCYLFGNLPIIFPIMACLACTSFLGCQIGKDMVIDAHNKKQAAERAELLKVVSLLSDYEKTYDLFS